MNKKLNFMDLLIKNPNDLEKMTNFDIDDIRNLIDIYSKKNDIESCMSSLALGMLLTPIMIINIDIDKLDKDLEKVTFFVKGNPKEFKIPSFCIKKIQEYLPEREKIINNFKNKYGDSWKEPKKLFINKKAESITAQSFIKNWNKTLKENNIKNIRISQLRLNGMAYMVNEFKNGNYKSSNFTNYIDELQKLYIEFADNNFNYDKVINDDEYQK